MLSLDVAGNHSATLERKIHLLERLVEVSRSLNSTLDLDTLLRAIMNTAVELLDCEAASVLLFDPLSNTLTFKNTTNFEQNRFADIQVPLESLAGKIFLENRPLIINDVTLDPRHYAGVAQQVGFQTRSLLGVPMQIQDRVTGVLEALNKNGGPFTGEDAYLLSITANQAAVAIRNSQMVRDLQAANEKLSRLDKMKSDFLGIASHELRTPLAIILGYATFLRDRAPGELSETAATVMSSALQLSTLVEAMTNMNLLERGLADLHLQPAVIQTAVAAAYDQVSSMAAAKDQLVVLALPDQDLQVWGDPHKLELIFYNILNNAVRFTPSGGQIIVWAEQLDNETILAFTDTGMGLAPAELKNIFKQFYQVEDHHTRRFGGLGLGLAIARDLVALHKGRIWAESDGLGCGSTFKVSLPLYPPK